MDPAALYAGYLQYCAGAAPRRTAAELETAVAALDVAHLPLTWETFWGKLDPAWFWGRQAERPCNDEPQANAVYHSLATHRGLL